MIKLFNVAYSPGNLLDSCLSSYFRMKFRIISGIFVDVKKNCPRKKQDRSSRYVYF